MSDDEAAQKAAEMLPDNPNNLRGAIRDVTRAVSSGWEIDPKLAKALQTRIAQHIYAVDANGQPTGKTPGPRTIRGLGALAVQMHKLHLEERKLTSPTANVTVPISAEQLRGMSDEELDALGSTLDRLVRGKV